MSSAVSRVSWMAIGTLGGPGNLGTLWACIYLLLEASYYSDRFCSSLLLLDQGFLLFMTPFLLLLAGFVALWLFQWDSGFLYKIDVCPPSTFFLICASVQQITQPQSIPIGCCLLQSTTPQVGCYSGLELWVGNIASVSLTSSSRTMFFSLVLFLLCKWPFGGWKAMLFVLFQEGRECIWFYPHQPECSVLFL